MKKIILLALLPVIGIIANNRPNMGRVKTELDEAQAKASVAWNALPAAEQELLQTTEEGKLYSDIRKDWYGCAEVHGHESSACAQIYQNLERALVRVHETPAYKATYLPVLRDKDYYFEKTKDLMLMVSIMDDPLHKEKSEHDAGLVAIDEIQKPDRKAASTVWIRWSIDPNAIQEEVKQDLRNFVQEITKH